MTEKEKKMTAMNNQKVKTETKKDITELRPNCGTSDCCGQCETAVKPIVKEEKQ